MLEITKIHRRAMAYADEAFIARRHENEKEALEKFNSALELERDAANIAFNSKAGEPTTSVLFRSAATLAYHCNNLREAEKLICKGLAGDPPIEIYEELKTLLEKVNFDRHLSLQGIKLDNAELQMSLAGNAVGHGVIQAKQVTKRIETFKKITNRTIERLTDKDHFRNSGTTKSSLNHYQPYISSPRAACFAFTIRFGAPSEQVIPGLENTQIVITEIIDNINMLNNGEEEKIREKFGNDDYYTNFLHLGKQLAPDGKNISFVGLTANVDNKEYSAKFNRRRDDFSIASDISNGHDADTNILNFEKTGILKTANANKNEISITGYRKHIVVPDGLSDIVKSYFDENVRVKLSESQKHITLVDIDPVE